MNKTIAALLFLLIVWQSSVLAQGGASYLYTIHVGGISDAADIKSVTEVISSFGNDVKISHKHASDEFKVGTKSFIEVSVLGDLLNTAGYHLGDVSISLSNESSQKSLPATMPQYEDTGDTEQDQANYKQAKQTWVNNNPDEYNAQFDRGMKSMTQKEFDAIGQAEKQRLLNEGTITITQ